MYLDHWQLDGFPFENTPDQRFYFSSEEQQRMLEDLADAAARRMGVVLLTGDIGCGKSTMSQHFLLTLPEDAYDIALITYPRLEPIEMLMEICRQLDIETAGSTRQEVLNSLQSRLQDNAMTGKHTLLCIDEAQSIFSTEILEELRLLLNFQFGSSFLMTLFFVGQPEFGSMLDALPQLKQRVALHLKLGHFDESNTIRYMLHRLRQVGCNRPILTRQAAHAIYRHTQGVPRRINHLLDRCLLMGMRHGSQLIDSRLVAETAARYPC